jgi:hypothetical protein
MVLSERNTNDEYILKAEAERMVREAVKQNSSYYVSLIEASETNHTKHLFELERRYQRVDRFLRYIKRQINGNNKFLHVDFELPLDNNGSPLGLDEIHQIDKLLQTGFDFRLLLKTIKEDETLANQWKGIMMTMRLSGYDQFQEDGETL